MFSKILAAATTVVAASASVQAFVEADAEIAFCHEANCQGDCDDLTIPFNGCYDAAGIVGVVVKCTPGGEGAVIDVMLETDCGGEPIFSDKIFANKCHSIDIPFTGIGFSLELAQCTNGTSVVKKLKL